MENDFVLEVQNLSVRLGGQPILQNIDLKIERGEVVAIIGRSGAGKTVLLKTIMGLLPPTSGALSFRFNNRRPLPIGFAFQKSPLFPWLSILQNLVLCTRDPQAKEKCEAALKTVGLEKYKDFKPRDISGGMAQKVNLVRTLANECELLLMDEPFASLDSIQKNELQQFTYDFCCRDDRSLLLVTHDIDEAILLADRVLVLGTKTNAFEKQIPIKIKKPKELFSMRSDPDYGPLYSSIYRALHEVAS